MNGTIYKIGADPEFFVRRNGHFISGHEFACGTKTEPLQTAHGFIQNDGFALECNVTPAETRQDFLANLHGVVTDLREFVHKADKRAEIVPKPHVLITRERLATLPPEVRKLGCEPDFNAYTRAKNPEPKQDVTFRTGAGHVHLGFCEGKNPRSVAHMYKCCALTIQLDYYLGLPSLLWDREGGIRRKLYGQAGAMRPKHYGLEYRVLSNTWTSDPKIAAFVFDNTVRAAKMLDAGLNLYREYGEFARTAINSGDTGWVRKNNMLAKEVLQGWEA